MEEKKAKSEKVGVGAWIALIVLILILSGAFRTMDGPIKVLDFTNLSGAFGTIGDTGANLIGSGGTGAKDGFMAGFNLIPAVMFFCGLLAVFEQLGAYKASEILFRPLLRPLLGIPGKCGIAFISSFTGSDVAAVMTRDLYEEGSITDDERTIFVAYQYAGSACINNTITGGAPLVAISPVALGPCILIMVFCKIIGANIVIVHGGGADINEALSHYDLPVEFKGGQRVTTPEVMALLAVMMAVGRSCGRLSRMSARMIAWL